MSHIRPGWFASYFVSFRLIGMRKRCVDRTLRRVRFAIVALCVTISVPACDQERVSDALSSLAPSSQGGRLTSKMPIEVLSPPQEWASANLLLNSGFENWNGDVPLEWSMTSGSSQKVLSKTEHAARGHYGANFKSDGSDQTALSQDVWLTDHGTYELRVLVSATKPDSRIVLLASDASANPSSFSIQSESITPATNVWTLGRLVFDVPAFVSELSVALQGENLQQNVVLDEFELYHTRATRQNLLANGDFELNLHSRHWRGRRNPYWKREQPGINAGSKYCLRIVYIHYEFSIEHIAEGLRPGGRYGVRGYIKTNNLLGRTFLRVRPTEKRYWGGEYDITSISLSGTTKWTLVEIEIELPADVNSVFVSIEHPALVRAGNLGKAWYDEIELFEYSDL